ncbi:MAG: Regulatory protein LuxR [Firmicutes bacterium]|nr:Regulatory protein LuxR [Bacillota bacterium]
MSKNFKEARLLSIAAFSFSFAYLLSFLFEGQVLYGIIDTFGAQTNQYILFAIISHFAGLFTCGYFVQSQRMARYTMIGAMAVCLPLTLPFFFAPSAFWLVGLVLAGYISGCAVAAWGYYLKIFTPKNERLKSCADMLIFSNIIMIAINVVAGSGFPFVGLVLSMLCLVIGIVLIWLLPVDAAQAMRQDDGEKLPCQLKKPMLVLFLFVAVITVNSGLMYQVINPAFEHLTGLVSWYWAVPYIITLAVMRNLPLKAKTPVPIYRYGHDYGSVHSVYAAWTQCYRLYHCGYADAWSLRHF